MVSDFKSFGSKSFLIDLNYKLIKTAHVDTIKCDDHIDLLIIFFKNVFITHSSLQIQTRRKIQNKHWMISGWLKSIQCKK